MCMAFGVTGGVFWSLLFPRRAKPRLAMLIVVSCHGTQSAKQSQIESSRVSIIGSICAKRLASKKRELDIRTPS